MSKTQKKKEPTPSAVAEWDQDSLSASQALDAIQRLDRQTLAEYLDDVLSALNLLTKLKSGGENDAAILKDFLMDASPVLAELASILSNDKKDSLRLIITARKGRPRKSDPLGKREKPRSAKESLDKMRQAAAKRLRMLSDEFGALDNQQLDLAATTLGSKAAPVIWTTGALLRRDCEKQTRLQFLRPKGAPKDLSQQTLAKKMTINATVLALNGRQLKTAMYELIHRYETATNPWVRWSLPKNESEFKRLIKAMRAEGTWHGVPACKSVKS